MKIDSIRYWPQTFKITRSVEEGCGVVGDEFVTNEPGRYHESLLRSFHIVSKLRELLELNTPAPVILEMLEMMTK